MERELPRAEKSRAPICPGNAPECEVVRFDSSQPKHEHRAGREEPLWCAHIDRLATYLAEFWVSMPCARESAVDAAIRIIGELRSDLELAEATIRRHRRATTNTRAQAEIKSLRSELEMLKVAINQVGATFQDQESGEILTPVVKKHRK